MANIFQSTLMTDFLYPLVLVFVLLFAILEKTEIFGKGKAQINAIISLVIGLIFVGFVAPKLMITNLMLFLSVGLFVIFLVLMLWGFISGNKDLTFADGDGRKIHKFFVFLLFAAIIFGVVWASGFGNKLLNWVSNVFGFLFSSGGSSDFFSNLFLIIIICVVIFVVIGFNPFSKGVNPWIKLGK